MQARTLYRALLRLYPAAFRHEYGQQMLLMFSEQLAQARRSGGPGRAALWMSALRDAVTIGPREHGHAIMQDLRYALRSLRKAPGFATVAIVSLALGLGANTAIFSLWNGVLHSPLPGVAQPEQLVMLTDPDESGSWTGRWDASDGPRAWLTYGEFEELRDQAGGFSAMMATQSSLSTWQIHYPGRDWEEVSGRLVSGGFFDALGVHPALGRLFTEAEDQSESPVAVVSHSYWQRRFGGRPDVLGTSFAVQQALLTIIGVAPPGFVGETSGQRPDLWLPLRMQPRVLPGRDRLRDTPPAKVMWLQVFARLKPGVTLPQAEAQANAVFQAGLESFYGSAAMGERRQQFLSQHIRVQPGARGASRTRQRFSPSLTALLAAVAVLLLIACANLANLLLARGAARRPEIALRAALGAGRERLIRQLFTESLALAALGGLAALAVAWLLHGVLVRMLAASDPSFHQGFTLDPVILSFAAVATLGAALLFGIFPAWQATHVDAGAALKEQSRGAIGSFGRLRSARFLVSVQLALSLPLLVGAGLLARTAHNLQRADLGFSRDRLLMVRVDLREGTEPTRRDLLLGELFRRIQRVPGVRAASFSQLGLFSGGESASTIEVEGHVTKGDDDRSSARDFVGPGYFSTLGIPVPQGRDIHQDDRGQAPRVCVINEAFARRFFAGRNPLGQQVTELGDGDQRVSHQVVGVARDARTQSLRDTVSPRYFLPAQQEVGSAKSPTFLIRVTGETGAALASVRQAVRGLDPGLPILTAGTLEEELAPLTAQDRATARLALVFGCVALALTAIGLYGVLAYGVARRTGEIAVRMALGAASGQVVGMILRETSGLFAVGLAMGGGLAFLATRLIESRLYGVAPHDPSILGLAAGVLLLVALGATYGPARRASRLDPMMALRRV